MEKFRLGFWEFVMVLFIFYMSLWLWNGLVALYICLSFSAISVFAALLMGLAEWVEPSRVQVRRLYSYYGASAVVPILVTILAIYVFKFPTFLTLK
ncbi:MAG: hypothetical protein RL757_2243 [Bacteroidota bacterium]